MAYGYYGLHKKDNGISYQNYYPPIRSILKICNFQIFDQFHIDLLLYKCLTKMFLALRKILVFTQLVFL